MTDEELIAALEACTLPPSEFTHANHVRVGYLYLRAGSFGEAIDRMSGAIRRYASSLGKAGKYHDTITVAFLALIRERMVEAGDQGGWSAFAAANPDLFDRELLLRYFPREQLDSDRARRVFVLPRACGDSGTEPSGVNPNRPGIVIDHGVYLEELDLGHGAVDLADSLVPRGVVESLGRFAGIPLVYTAADGAVADEVLAVQPRQVLVTRCAVFHDGPQFRTGQTWRCRKAHEGKATHAVVLLCCRQVS